jgi:sugar phosphate isomerase/epimerase
MTPTPAKIGVSLSPLYLTQRPEDVDQAWFGPSEPFLRALSQAGVTHIELRAITPRTDPAMAEEALRRVWSAGLQATLHGTLPPAGDDWMETVGPLIGLLRLMGQKHPAEVCPVTMHACAAAAGDVGALADQTVAILSRVARWMENENLPAALALEINRAKGRADPSITYEGVRAMQQRADHRRVGICWDLGHTWSNILTDGLNSAPPPDFLSAVIHTHIHDLGPTAVTHWPLTEGRLPLSRFVRSLSAAGYRGVWNLEFEPKRYAAEARIRERVLESVGLLGAAVAAADERR